MNLHTVSARSAAALVAVIAGAASWEHIASVAYGAGERAWVAYSLPAAIDGLIVVGVAALLEDRARGLRSRWRARTAVVAGVLATLAANIASAEPTVTARLVAVAAPVSFLLAVEVLTRPGRQPAAAPDPPTSGNPPSATESAQTDRVGTGSRTRARSARSDPAARVAGARARHPAATQQEVARRLKVSPRTVARYWTNTTNGDTTGAALHQSQPKKSDSGSAEPSPNSREHSGAPVTVDA
jgi:hypothetical protein